MNTAELDQDVRGIDGDGAVADHPVKEHEVRDDVHQLNMNVHNSARKELPPDADSDNDGNKLLNPYLSRRREPMLLIRYILQWLRKKGRQMGTGWDHHFVDFIVDSILGKRRRGITLGGGIGYRYAIVDLFYLGFL